VERSFLIRWLFAVLLIAGLMTAPFTAPLLAGAADSASLAMGMSDDMPCCPDKSAPVDCDKCLLMAICMFKTFQALPSAGVVGILPTTVRTLVPRSDPETESLGHPPPPRPPQSLVRSA